MIKETSDGLLIRIKIVPNSSKNDLIIEDEFIKVKVTAQPIENKANKALVEFLSKRFKVPKTSIEIVKGDTSKEKTLLFSIKDEEKREALVVVDNDNLKLAIGRKAINVRLASKLTRYKLEVKTMEDIQKEGNK